MASGVSVRDKLVASYYVACDPLVAKTVSDAAKVNLEADIYQLLPYSDRKTQQQAESILSNKHFSIPQKLSTLRVIGRSVHPYAFAPDLRHLLSINAKRIQGQRRKWRIRQSESQRKVDLTFSEIGRMSYSSIPSAAAVAHTDGREEKRGPSTASAPDPSTARPSEPRHIEISVHAPAASPPSQTSTPSNIAHDHATGTRIRFFSSMIFAAMVAYRASE